MINLTHLNLSRNKINDIPEEINKLVNLEYLYLNNNNICWGGGCEFYDFPQEIYSLKKLKKLWIHDNFIGSINKDINNLKSIEYISLKNNKIINVSDGILGLEYVNNSIVGIKRKDSNKK